MEKAKSIDSIVGNALGSDNSDWSKIKKKNIDWDNFDKLSKKEQDKIMKEFNKDFGGGHGILEKGGEIERTVYFNIDNNYIGNLELGHYTFDMGDYKVPNAFWTLSDAIETLFKYLKSEDGKYFIKEYPKSKFTIRKVDTSKKPKKNQEFHEEIVFQISAKQVAELQDLYKFKQGGEVKKHKEGSYSTTLEKGGQTYASHILAKGGEIGSEIDISITNENHATVGKAIQKALDETTGGYFEFNYSQSKRNIHGVEQVVKFNVPLKYFGWQIGMGTINYDGQWYKGYYRVRGERLHNFKIVSIKDDIDVKNVKDAQKEFDKIVALFGKLSKIKSEVKPLDTKDSEYESFEETNNYISYAKGGELNGDFYLDTLYEELDNKDYSELYEWTIVGDDKVSDTWLLSKAKQIAYLDYCNKGKLKQAGDYLYEANKWFKENKKRYAKGGSIKKSNWFTEHLEFLNW